MSLYKRGRVYWYTFSVDGERYRGTTRQTNEKKAQIVEANLLTKAHEQHGLLPRKAPRLIEFVPLFKKWNDERLNAGKLKPRSVRYYKFGCELLLSTDLAHMKLDRINNDEVQATSLPGSGSYKNQAIRTLHRLLELAASKRLVRVVPKLHLYSERKRETVISGDAETAVVANCSKAVRDAMWIMKDCGLRRDEVARLSVDWIDWTEKVIMVPDGKTANARRLVPMSERVINTLLVRCGEKKSGFVFPSKRTTSGHINPDSLSRGFSRARNDANLSKDVVLYSARHTFGTDVYDRTKNLKVTAKAMGHSATKVTERYVHPEHVEVVREAINARNLAEMPKMLTEVTQ